MGKLTDKQRSFIEHYCSNGFNATQAAISAGYSEKTAQEQGSRLLTNVMVSEAIQKFTNKATKKALITTEDVVRGLLKEAEYEGEGASPSARVSAWKALTDYTGGFDNNKQKVETKVQTVDDSNLSW